MRKQKPRSSESGSLNDEIDALEQEIANASTSASRVGLKKRLAQKKAILIRQERKAGQARREAERAAEAERIRKKKMQDCKCRMKTFIECTTYGISHILHYRKQFQTSKAKSNSGIYESHSAHHDSKNFMPHIRHSNIFNLHHINNHRCILDSSIISNKITKPTNGVYPGQYDQQQNYDQSFESTQKPNPVYGHGYGANKPREVDADNWSPGDWRNRSISHTNQVQGGVGSAPFANDYTWNKERY